MKIQLEAIEVEEEIINNKVVEEAIEGNIRNNRMKMIGGWVKKLNRNKIKRRKKKQISYRMTGMFRTINRSKQIKIYKTRKHKLEEEDAGMVMTLKTKNSKNKNILL